LDNHFKSNLVSEMVIEAIGSIVLVHVLARKS
jgi:hypothetical protein